MNICIARRLLNISNLPWVCGDFPYFPMLANHVFSHNTNLYIAFYAINFSHLLLRNSSCPMTRILVPSVVISRGLPICKGSELLCKGHGGSSHFSHSSFYSGLFPWINLHYWERKIHCPNPSNWCQRHFGFPRPTEFLHMSCQVQYTENPACSEHWKPRGLLPDYHSEVRARIFSQKISNKSFIFLRLDRFVVTEA